jgi:hypothetical protein
VPSVPGHAASITIRAGHNSYATRAKNVPATHPASAAGSHDKIMLKRRGI